MFAVVGLGGFEIILLLLALLVFAAMVCGAIVLVIWLTSRKKKELTDNQPGPTGTKRFCRQCGKEMSPDAPQGLCPTCLMKVAVGTEGGSPDVSIEKKPAPSPSDIAMHFPQLEILELLGQGGMGMVYKARQKQLDRTVALKVLPPELCRDPAFVERFTREAKALARLSHPNIVAVYDFGQSDGLCYVIMEYVDGLNLRQMEASRRLAPREALDIVPRICEALQFAHDQGIVHRDIKPENILIDKQGRVKIADFGLAKILGQPTQNFRLTGSAHIMGTPHYMAPEQVERPLEVDHRADIYSLGVVFYEMLTGELPLGRFAAPSQKVEVDVRLDEVVLKTLEKEPQRRYQQASEVKTHVETISSTPNAQRGRAKARDANPEQAWKSAFVRVENGKSSILWPAVLVTTGLLLAVMSIVVFVAWLISNQSFNLGLSLLLAASIVVVWMGSAAVANYLLARTSSNGPGGKRGKVVFAAILVPLIVTAALIATVSMVSKLRSRNLVPVVWVADEPTVQVHGVVTDADTGEPIPGVRVADIFFERGPERAVRVFWTDDRGRYVFNTWNEGNHVINFSAPNYEAGELAYMPANRKITELAADFQMHKKTPGDALKPVPPEAADLFDSYPVNKTWSELSRTANPTLPEQVQAALAMGMIDADPATAISKYVLDVPKFPAGALTLTITSDGREWVRQTKTLTVVVYRQDLAGVVSIQRNAQGQNYITQVLGRRQGRWKIYLGADMPELKSAADAERNFKDKAADLLQAFKELPDQQPTALNGIAAQVTQGMRDMMSIMLSTVGQIQTNAMTQLPSQREALIERLNELRRVNAYTDDHPLVQAVLSKIKELDKTSAETEVLRAKLREAEDAAMLAEQRYKAGLMSSLDYQAAQDEVLIRRAEMSGDAVAIERAKLVATQHQVDALKSRFEAGLVSAGEQQAAQRRLETQLAELRVAQANQISSPPYGSIVEGVLLSIADQKPVKGFDLERNQQVPLPASMERSSESQFFNWMAEHGVDIMAFGHRKSWDLFTSLKLAATNDTLWNQPDYRSISAALRSGTPKLPVNDPDQKSGFRSYRLDVNTPLPQTFAFETTSGALGVLQFTAIPITPPGVKFRYKLVGESSEASARLERPDTATIAEIDAAAKLDFDSRKMEALNAIAGRANLSSAAQVHLVKTAMTQLGFENMKVTVLQTLIKNPAFCEAARQALMENLNQLTFESNKQSILSAVNQRLSKNK